jgi:hypothetical protein
MHELDGVLAFVCTRPRKLKCKMVKWEIRVIERRVFRSTNVGNGD